MRAPGGGYYATPGGSADCGERCPVEFRKLANDPGIVQIATIIGGPPARVIAAYCATGDLDESMRKAANDLAVYYSVWAGLFTVAAFLFPPAALMVLLAGAAAAICKALGTGNPPSTSDVEALSRAGSTAQEAYGADPTQTESGKEMIAAVSALWDVAQSMGLVKEKPPTPTAPGSDSPCSISERDRLKRAAIIRAKGKAAAKLALCARRGGVYDGTLKSGCRTGKEGAMEVGKQRAAEKNAECVARGGRFDPTTPSGCTVAPPPPAPEGASAATTLVLPAAAAAAGFAVAGPVGAVVGGVAGFLLGSRSKSAPTPAPGFPRPALPALPGLPRLPSGPPLRVAR